MPGSHSPMGSRSALALAIGMAWAFAVSAAPLPKHYTRKDVKEHGLRVSAVYDPARSTWKAEKIEVAGRGAVEYKEACKQGPWTFDGARAQGAAPHHQRLRDVRIAEGRLAFTTEEHGELWWGNLHDSRAAPLVGRGDLSKYTLPVKVVVRLRQSLESSQWRVVRKAKGSDRPRTDRRTFTISGTDWQERTLSGWVTSSPQTGFGLKTETPGNEVEIDWVKAVIPSTRLFFRKTVKLDSKPVEARLCLFKHPLYRIFINGSLARDESPLPSRPGARLVRVEGLAKYFREGENVIALESDSFTQWGKASALVLEGMVRCESGKVTIIKTDSSWKGSYEAPKNWTDASFDDAHWQDCVARGKPKGNYGYDTDGYFLSPPYSGPVEVKNPGSNYFICNIQSPVQFAVTVYPNNFAGPYDLKCELKTAGTEKVVHQGTLATGHDPSEMLERTLTVPVREPGVYDLLLTVHEGERVVDTHIEEVAVVGRIAQREVIGTAYEEGLDLELMDEVDVTDPESPHRLFSHAYQGQPIDAPVRDTPLGRYRESGKSVYSMFGFAVELPRPYEPYLVEAEVPDDKPRVMSVRAVEMSRYRHLCNDGSGYRGWAIASPGVYCGFDQPLTYTWKKLRFIIFPKNDITGLSFTTNADGLRAAARKVRIYRIRNGLPALKVASPSHRLTGLHTEALTLMTRTFSGEDGLKFYANMQTSPHRGFLRGWYTTIDNMIRYMRFIGENMVIAGIYMYDPINRDTWHSKRQANVIELMGGMFAANDMKVLIGVEYSRANFTRDTRGQVSDAEAADGAETRAPVSKDGVQNRYWGAESIHHPGARGDFLHLIREICDLYGKTPGIAGLALQEGVIFLPGLTHHYRSDPLDFCYADATIAAFEGDTGAKVPVDGKDRERFRKRYDWIMANCLERWTEWRNASVFEANREVGRLVRAANADWRTYIFPLFDGREDYAKGVSPLEIARKHSMDPRPYQADDSFVFGSKYIRSIRVSSEKDAYLKMRQWCIDPDVIRVGDNGAYYLKDIFFESCQRYKNADWYYELTLGGDFVLPHGRNCLKAFATIMSHATPKVLAQVWIDCNMMSGHEQERREMNRVLRVIPPGQYRNLVGNAFDENVVTRAAETGTTAAFYLVNPTRFSSSVSLTVGAAEKAGVRDLAIGADIAVEDGRASMTLKPFEVRAFELQGAGAKITGSQAAIVPEERQKALELAASKAEVYAYCLTLSDDLLAKALKGLHLVMTASEARDTAQRIVQACQRGDCLTVARLVEPYPMTVWETFLKGHANSAKLFAARLTSIRVNVGSDTSCQDRDGNVWLADQQWLNGVSNWGTVAAGPVADRSGETMVGDTRCPDIFKSERYRAKGYRFKMENGDYVVKLHFAEFWQKRPDGREFDIIVQGKKVAERFDVFEEAGGNARPVVKSFAATVKDEPLAIDFEEVKGRDVPMLNGIEIVKNRP